MKLSNILKIPILTTVILASTFSISNAKWTGRERLADHIAKCTEPIRSSDIYKEYLVTTPYFEYNGEEVKAEIRIMDYNQEKEGLIEDTGRFKLGKVGELRDKLIISLCGKNGEIRPRYYAQDLHDHEGGKADLVDAINEVLHVYNPSYEQK